MPALKKRKKLIFSLSGILFSLVLSCAGLEIFFRVCIYYDILNLKNPRLYADYYSDDLFWLLRYHWEQKNAPYPSPVMHETLGKVQNFITEGNPLGLQENTYMRLVKDGRKKILFYGNSFVKGVSEQDYEIPRILERHLLTYDVLDMGVGASGVDQMYLLFQKSFHKVSHPFIIVGVMFLDIDRAVLKVRDFQKPYFTIQNDQLHLNGIPVLEDANEYFLKHPPKISFFLRFIKMKLNQGKDKRIQEKKYLNKKIIEAFHSTSIKNDLPLLFVIFYPLWGLEENNWREMFIKETLMTLKIPFIDTKKCLLEYAYKNNISTNSFYDPVNGHHNNAGNSVIAQAIFEELSSMLK